MLRTLYIKHYALIEEISVEFGRGLNILTGETGAGKSILIDALQLALGNRADSATMVSKYFPSKAFRSGRIGPSQVRANTTPLSETYSRTRVPVASVVSRVT